VKCSTCGGDHAEVYVHSKCHPTAPSWVILSEHAARVVCAVCEAPILELDIPDGLSEIIQ